MKKLTAKGKDIGGDTHEFDCSDGKLICFSKRLIELSVPEGVAHVWCSWNQLTELKIPIGVKKVFCSYNQLTELKIPIGVRKVFCHGNQLTHFDLPDSVTELKCDKVVKGLEQYIGKIKMNLL